MGCWSWWWWWWNKRTSITQRKKIDADADASDAAAAGEGHVISSYDDDDDDDQQQQQQQQLPDDIIAEILSRLPSMHVMKFRYICKQWFAVTSTQSFRELHYKMNQQLHTSFVAQYHDPKYINKKLENLFFNENQPTSDHGCFEKRQFVSACFDITLYQMKMKPLITQWYNPTLISSYKGFLLFKHVSIAELVLIFHNPITSEQVTVTAPASRYLYCGFYYHSPTEEYRVLFGILDDDDDNEQHAPGIRFAILGLRTRSLRRIRNVSHHCPSSSIPPIILNGALYWMVSESSTHGAQVFSGSVPNPNCSETILSFGMEREEFHVMPHPGKKCGQSHDTKMDARLMVMDGQLCFCVRRPVPNHLKLEIWVLEDHKEWIWVKKHVVMLGLWALHVGYNNTVDALFIDDGELMLDARSSEHLHFLYNLKNGSLRRLEITKLLESGMTFKSNIMVVHHPSLFSLHTKKIGYVLSLNEVDDRVAEWNLNQACRTYPG